MVCRASACATSSRQNGAVCIWVCSTARLARSKKGPAWISRDSHSGEAGVGAGGGDSSLGRLRGGATWRCRSMASRIHVRSAVVSACVNCHRSSSTVGAVSTKRGPDRGRIDRTPLTWFQMLWAVGLATCGGAPATGGTMCVGRLLLTKDGACWSLSKIHAYNCWNTWKCHVATTTLQCACTGRKDCRRECGNCKRVHITGGGVASGHTPTPSHSRTTFRVGVGGGGG